MMPNGEGTKGIAVIGLRALNKFHSLGLRGRKLSEVLHGHLDRCFNGLGAWANGYKSVIKREIRQTMTTNLSSR